MKAQKRQEGEKEAKETWNIKITYLIYIKYTLNSSCTFFGAVDFGKTPLVLFAIEREPFGVEGSEDPFTGVLEDFPTGLPEWTLEDKEAVFLSIGKLSSKIAEDNGETQFMVNEIFTEDLLIYNSFSKCIYMIHLQVYYNTILISTILDSAFFKLLSIFSCKLRALS